MTAPLPPAWAGLVDDAAIFPPGDAPLPDAVAAHRERREEWWADLVGSFVVSDVKVPEVDAPLRLAIVVTGGAGAIEGALRLAARGGHEVAGVEIALRDLDDLPGNARRVAAAADACGSSPNGSTSSCPTSPTAGAGCAPPTRWPSPGSGSSSAPVAWRPRAFPAAHALARWIDAALDRETPFKCTAGLHHAVAQEDAETGFGHHGFLNVLLATVRAFDGTPVDEVAALLGERDPGVLVVGGPRRGPRPRPPLVHLLRLLLGQRAARRPARPRTPGEAVTDTWVEGAAGSLFDVDNLPYGVFSRGDGEEPRVGVRIGDLVLDVAPVAAAEMLDLHHVFQEPTLNPLMAEGAAVRRSLRTWLTGLLTDGTERDLVEPHLVPVGDVTLHLPVAVADYVDFYASLEHATNVGRIFRPDAEALLPNWRHLPVGYHGRAGTVVASGTDVVRPQGQRKAPTEESPSYGPSRRLDIEAELGFVVGSPSTLGDAGRRRPTSPTTSSASSGSTTGRRATSRRGSTSRSARSSASRSPPRSPTG